MKTTRQKAMQWWNNLDIVAKAYILSNAKDKNIFLGRKVETLTGREIEQLWKQKIKSRLEYLMGEIQAERISTGEILELNSLKEYIEPGDVELLEWAGVPEFPG